MAGKLPNITEYIYLAVSVLHIWVADNLVLILVIKVLFGKQCAKSVRHGVVGVPKAVVPVAPERVQPPHILPETPVEVHVLVGNLLRVGSRQPPDEVVAELPVQNHA